MSVIQNLIVYPLAFTLGFCSGLSVSGNPVVENEVESSPKVESIFKEDSISQILESDLGVSLSEKTSDVIDSDVVLASLEGKATLDDAKQLTGLSITHLFQQIQESNPETDYSNLSLSTDPSVITLNGNEYYTDSFLNEYVSDTIHLAQSVTSQEDVSVEAREVARNMVLSSLTDVEVGESFFGNNFAYVKGIRTMR